jgi:C-terminal processing protease CtpA/Prc
VDWGIIAAIAIPFSALLFSLYRWFVTNEDKKEEAREKRWDEHLEQEERRHNEHEKRWREQQQQFLRYEQRIAKNERDMTTTRDEMHRDYVREDQMKEFRIELRETFNNVFAKLSAISRDLNQVIGELNSKRQKGE